MKLAEFSAKLPHSLKDVLGKLPRVDLFSELKNHRKVLALGLTALALIAASVLSSIYGPSAYAAGPATTTPTRDAKALATATRSPTPKSALSSSQFPTPLPRTPMIDPLFTDPRLFGLLSVPYCPDLSPSPPYPPYITQGRPIPGMETLVCQGAKVIANGLQFAAWNTDSGRPVTVTAFYHGGTFFVVPPGSKAGDRNTLALSGPPVASFYDSPHAKEDALERLLYALKIFSWMVVGTLAFAKLGLPLAQKTIEIVASKQRPEGLPGVIVDNPAVLITNNIRHLYKTRDRLASQVVDQVNPSKRLEIQEEIRKIDARIIQEEIFLSARVFTNR